MTRQEAPGPARAPKRHHTRRALRRACARAVRSPRGLRGIPARSMSAITADTQPQVLARDPRHERRRPRIARAGTWRGPDSRVLVHASRVERGTPRRVADPSRDLDNSEGQRVRFDRLRGLSATSVQAFARIPEVAPDGGRRARERARRPGSPALEHADLDARLGQSARPPAQRRSRSPRRSVSTAFGELMALESQPLRRRSQLVPAVADHGVDGPYSGMTAVPAAFAMA